ncbi:MAG: NAD-dependent epimerase/dehydratase family protein, partial [Chloroflexota bacterium]
MTNSNQAPSDLYKIDKSRPVMITGATGYVAGWIVKRLLEEGLTIHAPVRDPNNPDKLKYLNELASALPGDINFFQADLLEEGSYAEAMAGCQIVFHTASPFSFNIDDPQKQLVEPALRGTKNILAEANRTESVYRVVLTSSVVAIYSDAIDLNETPNGIFDESNWNKHSSLSHNAYAYSKTLAERAAWELCEAQSRWDLVTVNPSFVLGPGINPFGTSASFNIIKSMGDGTYQTGTLNLPMGTVDVREVAEAHIAAAFIPEAQGRHIVSGTNSSFPEIAAMLHEEFGADYPIPTRVLPKPIIWLVGPLVDSSISRKIIRLNVNYPLNFD